MQAIFCLKSTKILVQKIRFLHGNPRTFKTKHIRVHLSRLPSSNKKNAIGRNISPARPADYRERCYVRAKT